MKQRAHLDNADCSWLRNVSTYQTKLPRGKTTATQTEAPQGDLSFVWTEIKMPYHCCGYKMAVFLHISTDLKWLQTEKITCVGGIYVSIIFMVLVYMKIAFMFN